MGLADGDRLFIPKHMSTRWRHKSDPRSSSNQASGDSWWTLVEQCLTKVYVLGLTF
jgi:hypothetical protein